MKHNLRPGEGLVRLEGGFEGLGSTPIITGTHGRLALPQPSCELVQARLCIIINKTSYGSVFPGHQRASQESHGKVAGKSRESRGKVAGKSRGSRGKVAGKSRESRGKVAGALKVPAKFKRMSTNKKQPH